jgi:hypothetical protein
LKRTLARRKLIVLKYESPNITTLAHAALMSDTPHADSSPRAALDVPTLEECTVDYNDKGVSLPLSYVAFSSSLAPGRDLSEFWVVDSASSINLTAFRSDFVSFDPPSGSSRVGGANVAVKDSGKVEILIPLVFVHIIRRTIHALYTLDLTSRSSHHIGRLPSVIWMQTHSGCEFRFPVDTDVGLLMVPRGMGVLTPLGNGLYLLSHKPTHEGRTPADSSCLVDNSVALTAQCDLVMWHRRFGHHNMHNLRA